jgi:transaldolase/glucose-6-phosphate isomerase
MKSNPVARLAEFDQSIWLDYIRRDMIRSGELARLIKEDGLRGLTSNPAIFEKAITGSVDYDEAIRALTLAGRSAREIYDSITIQDVQSACRLFQQLFEHSGGRHGFVSLEVSPHLAHDTEATIAEAKRLFKAVDRPNVMIKVPGTREGLPAIRDLIREGINVNVTLLFGLPRYREVAEAYISGLEGRIADGKKINRVASVASFFLSRIDVLVDPMLEKMDGSTEQAQIAKKLHGEVAIASAKMAYQIYKEIFGGPRFSRLADEGARPQRVLWASTSTKNPDYSDVKYVEPLIGPETVNTVPPQTLDAYRDHGDPALCLEEGLDAAEEVFHLLPEVGIDIDQITQQLEDEGVEKFNKPFDKLMEVLEQKRSVVSNNSVNTQSFEFGEIADAVARRIDRFEKDRFCQRLWEKDPELWKSESDHQKIIRNALGWLDAPEKIRLDLATINDFVADVKQAGYRHVVHMGMGGSSLAPLVFQRSFRPGDNDLTLSVLDTTDPASVLAVRRNFDLDATLFIVASKSGTTAEPRAFEQYFYQEMKDRKGSRAGEHFVAITDPGTPLAKLGAERGYRRVFLNSPDVGGRYSALTYFGLVPAALMGLDVEELLIRAERMVRACGADVAARENPGVSLGAAMGELARDGRDKVTLLASERIATFGLWLEQLLAESTGKESTGLIPVAEEPLGAPGAYGEDRLFVAVRLSGGGNADLDKHVARLRQAGHPLVSIELRDPLDLAQEFFRWEVAVAAAGSVLGVDPFDQPNVQESKDNTDALLKTVQRQGRLPEEKATVEEGPLRIYESQPATSVEESLGRLFAEARAGNYVALMAFLTEAPETDRALAVLRTHLRNALRVATTSGYGPRFLHSTGQLHKGGPNSGLFLQLTADDQEDVAIPDSSYSFGVMRRAQAAGDLQALRKHGRRVLRVHLGAPGALGLETLVRATEAALSAGTSNG